MKHNVIIAGVGGQGVLSVAAVLAETALAQNLNVRQSEVHGMAQRGGAVCAHLRIADTPLHASLIRQGEADMILAMEPMEALRYIPWLEEGGWIVANKTPVSDIANYPDPQLLMKTLADFPKHIVLDADKPAREAASPKSANMVMLGAASPLLDMPQEALEKAILRKFQGKGKAVAAAILQACRLGRKTAEAQMAGTTT